MAQTNRLRVGVIGCGTVAQIMHLPYLHSMPDLFEIAALSDLSPGLLKILAAAKAGKHVLVEKPMCFTLREADEIIAAVKKAKIKLMVAYMKRYDPGYRYAQKAVKQMKGIRYVQINTLHPSEDQYWNIHGVTRVGDVPQKVL